MHSNMLCVCLLCAFFHVIAFLYVIPLSISLMCSITKYIFFTLKKNFGLYKNIFSHVFSLPLARPMPIPLLPLLPLLRRVTPSPCFPVCGAKTNSCHHLHQNHIDHQNCCPATTKKSETRGNYTNMAKFFTQKKHKF